MRKRVKKQLREQEQGRHKDALDRIYQLTVENAHLLRTFHACDEKHEKLKVIFEQLQAESDAMIPVTEAKSVFISEQNDTISQLNSIIQAKEATINKLKQPWWRRWFRRGIEGRKGS